MGGAAWLYLHYKRTLTGGRSGTPARQKYDDLRAGLQAGGITARFYAEWLGRLLRGMDWLLGDSGVPRESRARRMFRLRQPAALWTAASFDRCLLMALVYPVAVVLFEWGWSGGAGQAGRALGIGEQPNGWIRAGVALTIFLQISAVIYSFIASGWKSVIAAAVAAAVAVAVAGAGAVAVAVAGAGAGAVFVAGAVAFAVSIAQEWALRRGRSILFNSLFMLVFIISALAAARWLSASPAWHRAGALLLFFGLLTLINAPFDWASLGLTRALLRCGLVLEGWWPVVLSLADTVIASVIVLVLALTMVVGAELFDALAVRGGGTAGHILPVIPLLEGLNDNPGKPEYWWLWATLFSTIIPSMLNLAIGWASLLRGIPALARYVHARMPASGVRSATVRRRLAALLTLQLFLGAALGIGTQGLIVYGSIRYALPFFAGSLLAQAINVAEWDAPVRLWILIEGAL